jgi:hypothetical protein
MVYGADLFPVLAEDVLPISRFSIGIHVCQVTSEEFPTGPNLSPYPGTPFDYTFLREDQSAGCGDVFGGHTVTWDFVSMDIGDTGYGTHYTNHVTYNVG